MEKNEFHSRADERLLAVEPKRSAFQGSEEMLMGEDC